MKYKIPIYLFVFLLSVEVSFGCSCAPVKLDSAYKYANIVFRGKVTEIVKNKLHNDVGPPPIIINFQILKGFKLVNKTKGDLISIVYSHHPCDFYFEENREYIVFAYDMGYGGYTTSVCSPTDFVDSVSKSDYQRLIELSGSKLTKYNHDQVVVLDRPSYKAMVSENEEKEFVIQDQKRKIELLIYVIVGLLVFSITYLIISKRKLSS